MLKIYPTPENEQKSNDFKVLLNGVSAPLNFCRVSALPFNRLWPGKQRDISQSEEASFLSFGMNEAVRVELSASKSFHEVTVRPLSKNIKPEIIGEKIIFTLEAHGFYTVELDGFHNALHIFADGITDFDIDKNDKNVIFFADGRHDIGELALKSNQTVYLSEGAVLHGRIIAENQTNIRVCGHGIIDGGELVRPERFASCQSLYFKNCKNIEVCGVTFRDSAIWTARLDKCENILFDNVKLIGMWRYNSDGIDLVNSSNAVIRNSFLRSFDDCVVLKGLKPLDDKNVENITVCGCVIWCDWGRALEIGAETCCDEFRNIVFEDIDIIHGVDLHMDFQSGDRADIHDVIFKNIRVEYSKYTLKPITQCSDDMIFTAEEGHLPILFCSSMYNNLWSKDGLYGNVHDVLFKDIYIYADEGLAFPPSEFAGKNSKHKTSNITIDGVFFNGERVGSKQIENSIKYNGVVEDIVVK